VTEVLIVEDNADISESLECLLTFEGYGVRSAPHGEAGLSALDDRLPDVVLLDVDMPVLDGPGMAYRMFVVNCGREKVPIVLCSAIPRLSDIAARVGTPYYIGKPPDPDKLLSMIARAAEERIAPRPPGLVGRAA
jgi:DNA-binding response OmpR family regulator